MERKRQAFVELCVGGVKKTSHKLSDTDAVDEGPSARWDSDGVQSSISIVEARARKVAVALNGLLLSCSKQPPRTDILDFLAESARGAEDRAISWSHRREATGISGAEWEPASYITSSIRELRGIVGGSPNDFGFWVCKPPVKGGLDRRNVFGTLKKVEDAVNELSRTAVRDLRAELSGPTADESVLVRYLGDNTFVLVAPLVFYEILKTLSVTRVYWVVAKCERGKDGKPKNTTSAEISIDAPLSATHPVVHRDGAAGDNRENQGNDGSWVPSDHVRFPDSGGDVLLSVLLAWIERHLPGATKGLRMGIWKRRLDAAWVLASAYPHETPNLQYFQSLAGHLDWVGPNDCKKIGDPWRSSRVCAPQFEPYYNLFNEASDVKLSIFTKSGAGPEPADEYPALYPRSAYDRLAVYIAMRPDDPNEDKVLRFVKSFFGGTTEGGSARWTTFVRPLLAPGVRDVTLRPGKLSLDDITKEVVRSSSEIPGVLLSTGFRLDLARSTISRSSTWVDCESAVGNLARVYRRVVFRSNQYGVEMSPPRSDRSRDFPRALSVFFRGLARKVVRIYARGAETAEADQSAGTSVHFATVTLFCVKSPGETSDSEVGEENPCYMSCFYSIYKSILFRSGKETMAKLLLDALAGDGGDSEKMRFISRVRATQRLDYLGAEVSDESEIEVAFGEFIELRKTVNGRDPATVGVWLRTMPHRVSEGTNPPHDLRFRRNVEPLSRFVEVWHRTHPVDDHTLHVTGGRAKIDAVGAEGVGVGHFHLFADQQRWHKIEKHVDGCDLVVTLVEKGEGGRRHESRWVPTDPYELQLAAVRHWGKQESCEEKLAGAYRAYFDQGNVYPMEVATNCLIPIPIRGLYVNLHSVRNTEQNFIDLARWVRERETGATRRREGALADLKWLLPERPLAQDDLVVAVVKILVELIFRDPNADQPGGFGMIEVVDRKKTENMMHGRGFELLAHDALLARQDNSVIIVLGSAGSHDPKSPSPVLAVGSPLRAWVADLWLEWNRRLKMNADKEARDKADKEAKAKADAEAKDRASGEAADKAQDQERPTAATLPDREGEPHDG